MEINQPGKIESHCTFTYFTNEAAIIKAFFRMSLMLCVADINKGILQIRLIDLYAK